MSEIKFDLNAWKEANELINEQLTEYLTKKNLCEQWKYLMDEESTFGFFDPDSSEYVWKTTEVYRKLYMGDASHWMFWDMFDFENLKREKNRLVACAKRSNEWDYEKFFDAEKAKNGESGQIEEYLEKRQKNGESGQIEEYLELRVKQTLILKRIEAIKNMRITKSSLKTVNSVMKIKKNICVN